MKWMLTLGVVLISALSHAGEQPRSIDVYGSSALAVNPDGIDWRLEVATYGDTMNEAKSLNDRALADLRTLLNKTERVETVEVNNPRLSRTYNAEEKKLKAFNAESYVTFKSFAVAKQQDLATGIAQIPGVSINSCQWMTTNETRIVKEARTLALAAAKDKAVQMADALGMAVGVPFLIEERSSRWEPTGLNIQIDQTGVTRNDSGGKVRVGANVRVVFELKEKTGPNQASQTIGAPSAPQPER
jgi:uncharacterized protein YggE